MIGLGGNTSSPGATNSGRTGGLRSIGEKPGMPRSTRPPSSASNSPVVKADQRLTKIRESMHSAKTAATSAAHAGVVARPMEKNISKMLDQRRAQVQGRGTSVARLGTDAMTNATGPINSPSADTMTTAPNPSIGIGRFNGSSASDSATRGASIARLGKPNEMPSYFPPPPLPSSPNKTTPPDLYGDL